MSNSVLSAPFFAARGTLPRAVAPNGSSGHSVASMRPAQAVAASTTHAARLSDDDHNSGQAVKLTRREIEVLTLVIEGNSSTEVADKLFVSKRTVDFHLANVYRKLSVKSRLQAYHEATRRGLLPGFALSSGSLAAAR